MEANQKKIGGIISYNSDGIITHVLHNKGTDIPTLKDVIQANDLRVGNWFNLANPMAGGELSPNQFNGWPSELDFETYGEPIPLTEELILKIRRINKNDHLSLEFSCIPPGERQIENNYWSCFIHEDYKLHLTPSYHTEWIDQKPQKSSVIKFWFIWYHGGSWFLPLMNIRQYPLKYLHQLQNLFFAIAGEELTINI